MAKSSKEAQDRAEASFKRKELQARDSEKALAEYEAAGRAMREKTARLRTLRLAHEAADKEAKTKAKPKKVPLAPKKPPATPKKSSGPAKAKR